MSSRFGHAKRRPVIGETISAIALPVRKRVDVGELPGLLVRIVGLDDQRAVQVAGVRSPRVAATRGRVRLLPGPDEGCLPRRRPEPAPTPRP